MTGRAASILDGTVVLVLSALVAGLSIFFFAAAGGSADSMALAGRIERRELVDAVRLERQVDRALTRSQERSGCGVVGGSAEALVAFRNFGTRNQATDFAGWARAAEASDMLLRHALRCTPSNGELWARLALVSRAILLAPERIDGMLRLSERLAPAEIDAIRMRSQLWGIGAGRTSEAGREAARRDLRRILLGALDSRAAGLLAAFRPAMEADIGMMAAELPPNRAEALNRRAALQPPAERKTSGRLLFLDEDRDAARPQPSR